MKFDKVPNAVCKRGQALVAAAKVPLELYTDLTCSGGFVIGHDGKISSVLWDSAAFNAGLTLGSEVVAVNGRKFDMDRIKQAITDAAKGGASPQLLVHDGDLYRTVTLDWHGGLRYPMLERTGKGPGTLDALLAPR